ncbi:class E sortase [Salinibacterium sp. dk2585]|uniref:class E sortase n=1 Tax=unclassified Salinibacterium TaxID=2632331 RepID=UPI0011C2554D|nr:MULTISPECIES: class E sortase [unclassified Salinibacterium]QEE62462.1 class E sortase [Salinibacterium sp. dk2585]TXK55177.1 class E sortase [Salinibacterium sp. dk5596]
MARARGGQRARPRASVGLAIIGVLGELFLTAGVLVLLFLGWQLWLNDIIVGNEQRDAAIEFSEDLANEAPAPADKDEEPVDPVDPGEPGEPVSTVAPVTNEAFATLFVPRFGADYVRKIGEGVGLTAVLNREDLGVGHYPSTQLPGEVGNFALAAHRTTWGKPFAEIGELQLGDKIYVQTVDGWYTYAFRNLEYVLPTGTGVLEPVPQAPGIEVAGERFITLTSCNPRFSAAERIIAYGVLESWQPASAGMPAELAAVLEGAA